MFLLSYVLQRQVTENITVAESLAIIENGVSAGLTKATILCSKCHAQVWWSTVITHFSAFLGHYSS